MKGIKFFIGWKSNTEYFVSQINSFEDKYNLKENPNPPPPPPPSKKFEQMECSFEKLQYLNSHVICTNSKKVTSHTEFDCFCIPRVI